MTLRVLVLGGLDPGGGAGLTADARALEHHGALALPVATALTVQNRRGFRRADPVPGPALAAALAAALDDGPVHAVKVGLLCDPAQVEAVASALAAARAGPVVVDPVLSATAGGYAPPPGLAAACRSALVPLATVCTPNLPEAAALCGDRPPGALLEDGCGAVLLKGGHGEGAMLVDRLLLPDGTREFAHARLPVGAVHGTGCALASSIAARLAAGAAVSEACGLAIGWLGRCLGAMGGPAPDGLPRPLRMLEA